MRQWGAANTRAESHVTTRLSHRPELQAFDSHLTRSRLPSDSHLTCRSRWSAVDWPHQQLKENSPSLGDSHHVRWCQIGCQMVSDRMSDRMLDRLLQGRSRRRACARTTRGACHLAKSTCVQISPLEAAQCPFHWVFQGGPPAGFYRGPMVHPVAQRFEGRPALAQPSQTPSRVSSRHDTLGCCNCRSPPRSWTVRVASPLHSLVPNASRPHVFSRVGL